MLNNKYKQITELKVRVEGAAVPSGCVKQGFHTALAIFFKLTQGTIKDVTGQKPCFFYLFKKQLCLDENNSCKLFCY